MRKLLRVLMPAALALSVCVGVSLALAAGTAPNADIDEDAVALNEMAKVEDVQTSEKPQRGKSADQAVKDLMGQYKRQKKIRLGNQGGDKVFAEAVQSVSVNEASPDFGKLRVTAYDQAYGQALGEIAAMFGVQVSSETLASVFQDESAKAKEFEEELATGKSTVSALIDKFIALGDAFASDKLREFGVDPEAFNAASPDRKKVLYSEAFNKKITTRMTQTLGGVVPVQTFVGTDGAGNWSVGVIIMYSQKLQAVAEALRLGQKPALVKAGPSLEEQIPFDASEKMFDMFGVRVLFDETGLVVVSYGQWSNSYNGSDPRMRSRYSKTAATQAGNLANAQLAEFLQSTYSSETNTEVGESMERAIVKDGKTGEVYEPSSLSGAVDVLRQVSKRKANANLKGLSTLGEWSYETPEGHEIVGVVKYYSFASMEAAKNLKTPPAQPKGAPKAPGNAGARMGEDQMDINTF